MNTPTPCVSFIGAVDFTQEAKWLFMTDSVTDLLGFEPKDLIGKSSLDLVHPDEFPRVKQIHYETIQQDKAAVLVYLRMRHKDPCKGYVLCGVSRTVVHNVLIGSVSFANPAKALHNASTAQEIEVITPSAAANFEFRRWHDPSPMPPSPIPREMASVPFSPSPSVSSSWSSSSHSRSPRNSPSPPAIRRRSSSSEGSRASRSSHSPDARPEYTEERRNSIVSNAPSNASSSRHQDHTASRNGNGERPTIEIITFDRLSNKSFRTAFILNRFSMDCHILYCSNNLLIQASDSIGHSFYDYVDKKDEQIVRNWIDLVKSWGVNEKGQPSDGGFGFGKFCLLTEPRDSTERMPEPNQSRNRHGSTSRGHSSTPHRSGKHHGHNQSSARTSPTTTRFRQPPSPTRQVEKFTVDAIFSAHSDGLMVILRRASEAF
ncbi:hypothetical protein CVT26_014530 [Gymnopilus dilepis]|uniref:PAS domain-containing protein n=1 Tax=Gymnopilus dilepis TaxID=231916 RepID=A0A409W3A0_9AGAR|nr:hypothetical protein CVT26_014530 [Gymnopilus dilepis]